MAQGMPSGHDEPQADSRCYRCNYKREKLEVVGVCTSRLLAQETELRVVKSYIMLLSTINPMFELCKGRVDFDALGDVVEIVKTYHVIIGWTSLE